MKAPGAAAPVSRRSQRFEWKVQARFTAEFSCEREQAPPRQVAAGLPAPSPAVSASVAPAATPLQTACMPLRPLRPLTLNFNAPVPREQALAARLLPEAIGAPIAPTLPDDERGVTPQSVRFAAPLAENTRFRLTLPPGLRDGAGRALANAGSFPLAVATGGLPPLAKFAGVPFGVPEPARTSATTGASASPTATRSACVTSPRDGSVFVLDPDIPMASRRLGFEGAPGRWTLDGRVLGDGERLRWLPQPGRHVLQRQGADAGDAVRVAFEVRAAPPPAARPTGSDR